jgi:hypothetical protein
VRKVIAEVVDFRERLLPPYAKRFQDLVSGWWFEVASGRMYASDRGSRSFKTIDCDMTDRLIGEMPPG